MRNHVRPALPCLLIAATSFIGACQVPDGYYERRLMMGVTLGPGGVTFQYEREVAPLEGPTKPTPPSSPPESPQGNWSNGDIQLVDAKGEVYDATLSASGSLTWVAPQATPGLWRPVRLPPGGMLSQEAIEFSGVVYETPSLPSEPLGTAGAVSEAVAAMNSGDLAPSYDSQGRGAGIHIHAWVSDLDAVNLVIVAPIEAASVFPSAFAFPQLSHELYSVDMPNEGPTLLVKRVVGPAKRVQAYSADMGITGVALFDGGSMVHLTYQEASDLVDVAIGP